MRYVVRKEFTFEAAHRLLKDYAGKCNNNHGHSWVITLHVEADSLDEKGMVMDFNDMKALKGWIDEHLDHATLLWEEDPLCGAVREVGQRVYIMDGNPTSEKIGEVLLREAQHLFNDGRRRVTCVEVSETGTSTAAVYA